MGIASAVVIVGDLEKSAMPIDKTNQFKLDYPLGSKLPLLSKWRQAEERDVGDWLIFGKSVETFVRVPTFDIRNALNGNASMEGGGWQAP